ncbi:protein THEM6 [Callorhinchus milii]|uniref:Protein THEM6 n=1 Tax=Callorhinchus milii TaxID=7868 RepID=V9KDM2_CALMI|nr:protein THEM6 [Callorhinchus milii]|eukprot:gi/632972389/ref/XP_007902634.1/ PREDICTED: protein THEM6 [Callorhinchus milii]
MWLAASLFSALLFALFDVWYFLRAVLHILLAAAGAKVRDILREQTINGIVLFHDIDFMGHMNNSRYLRECDFARLSLFIHNGLFKAVRSLNSAMVLGASTIRYRRSLNLFEQFRIQSKILCWDEKAFYVEQEFISRRDNFVCATMLCRQNVLRSSPDKLLQFLCKRKVECPDFPEEVQSWINYNMASSNKLKRERDYNTDPKQQ